MNNSGRDLFEGEEHLSSSSASSSCSKQQQPHYNSNNDNNSEIEMLVHGTETGTATHYGSKPIVDEDEKLLHKLGNKTLIDDVFEAFHNAKYVALFAALFCGFLVYQYTVVHYHAPAVEAMNRPKHTWETLQFIRPVLDSKQQKEVHDKLLYGETSLHMPNNDAISFGFQRASDKYGSFQLPELFYQGVFFSVGLGNSHNVPYASVSRKGMEGEEDFDADGLTEQQRAAVRRELLSERGRNPAVVSGHPGTQHTHEHEHEHEREHEHHKLGHGAGNSAVVRQHVARGGALLRRLHSLNPKPMYITPRVVTNNSTNWFEEGYMVYYSYKQLDAAGLLSSKNPTQPWSRVSEKLLDVAREFRQMYVTVYYAHAFGPSTSNQMVQTAEKNRRHRLLLEKEGKYTPPPPRPNARTSEYHLHQSYEEEFTHTAPSVGEVELIDDEVTYYRSVYPSRPITKSKGFRPRRSQRSLEQSSVVHPTTADGKSVIQAIKDAYTVTEEEKHRRRLQGELRDEHGHKYETVVQLVLPTHTGMDEIKSSCAVWLSKFNHQRPSELILKDFEAVSEGTAGAGAAPKATTGSRSLFTAPIKPTAATAGQGFTFTEDNSDGGTRRHSSAAGSNEAGELTPLEASVAFLHTAPRALFNALGAPAPTTQRSHRRRKTKSATDTDADADADADAGVHVDADRDLDSDSETAAEAEIADDQELQHVPVQLPYYGPGTDTSTSTSIDYFDFLLSYNHVAKLKAENVVYQREWYKNSHQYRPSAAASTSEGGSASTVTVELMSDENNKSNLATSTAADEDLHWSAYVPYDVAAEYARKYELNPADLLGKDFPRRK